MDRSILWRAAAAQVLLVAAISLILALALPHSFFDDWGWLTGPAAWLACAAITAWALRLPVRGVMLGAVLAGIPSARLLHPQGVAGFADENLVILAATFHDTVGC